MREAIVSGSFYEQDRDSLKRQIESCFKNKLGAGINSLKSKSHDIQRIFSVICPHAGYAFSGPCASYSYSELLKIDLQKDITFIILGPNHSGSGRSEFSISLEDFRTPFGIIVNHSEFSREFLKQEKLAKNDEESHENEHSIEVQLPFLQYCIKRFRIVPIVCSTQSYEKLIKFSKSLAKTIKKQEKENPNLKFVIIASSDLTHYGPEYGFSPFPLDSHTKKNLYSLDNSIIQEILKLDPKGFYNQTSKSTVCGKSPIVIAIETSKLLGAKSGQLLKYYVSGDIVQEYENSVGYASLVIR